MQQKVLVGITIQENSRRLMNEGYKVASALGAPLHILHIRQGETIFDNPDSSSLLEELFAYGGELGGEVHFLCSNHVSYTFADFIKKNHVTHLVIGETPTEANSSSHVYENLKNDLGDVEITVLPRQQEDLSSDVSNF